MIKIILTFCLKYDIMYIPEEKSSTGVQLSCEREFKRIYNTPPQLGELVLHQFFFYLKI